MNNKKSKNTSKTRVDLAQPHSNNRKMKKMLSTKLGKNTSKNRGQKKISVSRMSQEKLYMANGSNSQLSEQTMASKVNNMGGSELSAGLEMQNKINRSSLFNTTQRKDTHESPFESHKNSREDQVKGIKFDQKGISLNQTLASVNSLKQLNLNHDKRQSADLGFDLINNKYIDGISIHLPTQGQGMMSPPYFATTAKQNKEKSRLNNNILTDGGTYL